MTLGLLLYTVVGILLRAFVIYEGIALGMTLIDVVILAPYFLPSFREIREEGVGLCGSVMNEGEAETVGERHCCLINRVATYYIYILFGSAVGEGFFERCIEIATREVLWFAGTAQHDITTVWECSLRKTLECAATHDDGMAGGERLEALQVSRQPVQQFVVKSDGEVLSHGSDDGNEHEFVKSLKVEGV